MLAILKVRPWYRNVESRTRPSSRTSNVGVPRERLNKMAMCLVQKAAPPHWTDQAVVSVGARTSWRQHTSTGQVRNRRKSCARVTGSAIPRTFRETMRSENTIVETNNKPCGKETERVRKTKGAGDRNRKPKRRRENLSE